MFSDILLTVDVDRTLTGPDAQIPPRNLEAIGYFIANGGAFTVNTGRTPATFGCLMDQVPCNAPLLFFNGSASWQDGTLMDVKEIALPLWETVDRVHTLFPDMNIEIQARDRNYLYCAEPAMEALEQNMRWKYAWTDRGQDLGPFLKFALWGKVRCPSVGDMYEASPEELARFDFVEQEINRLWGAFVTTARPAPRIIDVQTKGVNKAAAAKALQQKLGRKILVCVGDGENDVPMLQAADFAFCPADAVVADRFCNVCPCGQGAVAEVIYEKLPQILGK